MSGVRKTKTSKKWLILSGMSNEEQLEKNLATFAEDKKLSEQELTVLQGIVDRMLSVGTVPCTACHCCVSHCPQQIKISEVLADFSKRLG